MALAYPDHEPNNRRNQSMDQTATSPNGITESLIISLVRRQNMVTKAQLRKRWTNPNFVDRLPIPRDRLPTASELQGLDLRGVPKLGNGGPLWHFAIRDAEANGIDFSFGDGCVVASGSTLSNSRFEEFRFDRATSFVDTTFSECDFQRARLRLSATDCSFFKCNFDLSTFAGGHSEYGFTRCTFTECSLCSARWKGTYFKACTFELSDLTQFQVIDSVVTCIKHKYCISFSSEIFSGGDIRAIIDIA